MKNVTDWVSESMQRVDVEGGKRYMIPAGAVTDKLLEMEQEIDSLEKELNNRPV